MTIQECSQKIKAALIEISKNKKYTCYILNACPDTVEAVGYIITPNNNLLKAYYDANEGDIHVSIIFEEKYGFGASTPCFNVKDGDVLEINSFSMEDLLRYEEDGVQFMKKYNISQISNIKNYLEKSCLWSEAELIH